MFNHAGRKIQTLAIIAFVLCVSASVFGGVYYLLNAYYVGTGISYIQCAWGCGIILGGTFASYLAALFLTAIGELVDSTTRSMEISEKLLKKTEQSKPEMAAMHPHRMMNPPMDSAMHQRHWFCTSCGTRNDAESTLCSNCSKKKI